MNPQAKAIIRWIPQAEGGRERPPVGPRYATIVRFDGDRTGPERPWTLVVEMPPNEATDLEVVATISFLVEAAPHHLLEPGRKFSLFEGPRAVARGEVVA